MSVHTLDAVSRSFNDQQFRQALSKFTTGVTVVTTRLAPDKMIGLTVNSFNSVSMNPPLVLWSLALTAKSLSIFENSTHYVVNVLASHQTHLAEQFSSKHEDRFNNIPYTLSPNEIPILTGVSAWFECKNTYRYPGGDHIILVGEVENCDATPQASLILHSGKFITNTTL